MPPTMTHGPKALALLESIDLISDRIRSEKNKDKHDQNMDSLAKGKLITIYHERFLGVMDFILIEWFHSFHRCEGIGPITNCIEVPEE